MQFEVKFRKEGILDEKELEKYSKLNNPPHIFLVSAIDPFIKIFYYQYLHSKYEEVPKGEDGTFEVVSYFEIPSELWMPSDILKYSSEILDKYSLIIKEWFKNK